MAKCEPFSVRRRLAQAAAVVLALAFATPGLAAPAQAPDFTLQLLGGGEVESAGLKGKVIVLNFWASWCVPCKRELADLDAAFVRHGGSRLAVFAIDAEHAPDRRRLLQQAAAMTIPVATGITAGYRPRNNAVPTTFVIDRAGKLVLTRAGALKAGEIDALIDSLLAANPASGTRH